MTTIFGFLKESLLILFAIAAKACPSQQVWSIRHLTVHYAMLNCRNVTQGNKLLSLWHGEPDISGATGSNIWQSNTVILHINMEFAYNIQFPPPLPQTPK